MSFRGRPRTGRSTRIWSPDGRSPPGAQANPVGVRRGRAGVNSCAIRVDQWTPLTLDPRHAAAPERGLGRGHGHGQEGHAAHRAAESRGAGGGRATGGRGKARGARSVRGREALTSFFVPLVGWGRGADRAPRPQGAGHRAELVASRVVHSIVERELRLLAARQAVTPADGLSAAARPDLRREEPDTIASSPFANRPVVVPRSRLGRGLRCCWIYQLHGMAIHQHDIRRHQGCFQICTNTVEESCLT